MEWEPIEHTAMVSWCACSPDEHAELAAEVFTVRHRAPEVPIRLPAGRPRTSAANRLYAAVRGRDPALAPRLRQGIYQALWEDGRDIGDPAVPIGSGLSVRRRGVRGGAPRLGRRGRSHSRLAVPGARALPGPRTRSRRPGARQREHRDRHPPSERRGISSIPARPSGSGAVRGQAGGPGPPGDRQGRSPASWGADGRAAAGPITSALAVHRGGGARRARPSVSAPTGTVGDRGTSCARC